MCALAGGGEQQRRRSDGEAREAPGHASARLDGGELVGERGALEHLALEQRQREPVEHVAVGRDELLGALLGRVEQPADLVVEQLVRALGDRREAGRRAEVLVGVGGEQPDAADPLAHAVAADELAGELRGVLDVLLGAGRRRAEDEVLGGEAAERRRRAGRTARPR